MYISTINNKNNYTMINTNSTRFQIEQNQFHSDKCPDCMSYTDRKGNCTNNFCSGLIPSEYR